MILQDNSAARNRGITLASIKGIIGNVVLVIFKMIVGLASNSIAIILDAVNNLTDVLSSVSVSYTHLTLIRSIHLATVV